MNREKEDENEVMTAKEVGEYLGFSKNWIYRKAEAGGDTRSKIGR